MSNKLISFLLLGLSLSCVAFAVTATTAGGDSWQTKTHEPGYCATYDICGRTSSDGTLSCARNIPAKPLDASTSSKLSAVCPRLAAEVGGNGGAVCCSEAQLDQIQKQTQMASIFLVGCPACNHNFKHFICTMTCSPDQATFTNVTAVQTVDSNGSVSGDSSTIAVAAMDIYLDPAFGTALYNSCADVIYPPLNQKAMKFVGGGAINYQQWVDFLGAPKPGGSPFIMKYPHVDDDHPPPQSITPLNETIPGCGDAPLACSCGDCLSAPGCAPPPPPPPPVPHGGCHAIGLPGPLTCLDLTLAVVYVAIVASLPTFVRFSRRLEAEEELEPITGPPVYTAAASFSQRQGPSGSSVGGEDAGALHQPLLSQGAGGSRYRHEEIHATCSEAGDQGSQTTAGATATAAAIAAKTTRTKTVVRPPASERLLRRIFRRLGLLCARRPWITLIICCACAVLCSLGISRLTVITDPGKLWVGSTSQAAAEKQAYEDEFGAFYRISQLILTTTPDADDSRGFAPSGLPAIATDANIKLLFEIQEEVDSLQVEIADNKPRGGDGDGDNDSSDDDKEEGVRLVDVCLKPLGTACATQSVLQYWQGSIDTFQDPSHLSPEYCVEHWSTACRAETGAPVDPHIVLGGFPREQSASQDSNTTFSLVDTSTAFVITYPLVSTSNKRAAVGAWEAAFIALAQGKLTEMANDAGLSLSFSTERSVQDELKRESGADVSTVAASYVLMLVYVAVALGRFPRGGSWRECLVCSRALLALGGVVIVAAAVAGALGICGWINLGATLIIMEVIPFLALAIGVDNVFLLSQAGDTAAATASSMSVAMLPAERAAAALASAGPSMLLAAAAESMGFAIGMLTSMPALQDFAACAALAIILDFVLQCIAFPAMLALDYQRQEEQRYDIFPFMKLPAAPWLEEDDEVGTTAIATTAIAAGSAVGAASKPATRLQQQTRYYYEERDDEDNEDDLDDEFIIPPSMQEEEQNLDNFPIDGAVGLGGGITGGGGVWGVGPSLRRYMRRIHAPTLMQPWVKSIVLAVFIGLFFLSTAMLPRLQKGLDQGVALPADSYLQHYFQDVATVLRAGPPVSFVVRNLNISNYSNDVRKVCSIAGCDEDSLLNRISAASRQPWNSQLASPAASWLDDFISWISPEAPQCCRLFHDGAACPPPDQEPCWDPETQKDTEACDECTACLQPGELKPGQLPSEEDFVARLPQFLSASPSQQCAKGGVGAYSDALAMTTKNNDGSGDGDGGDDNKDIAGLDRGVISASAFRAYYVPLSSQQDFISALRSSRQLAADASQALQLDVFAYSIFHIFFEQYLNLGGQAVTMLGSAAVVVFVLTLAATGSPWAATVMLGVLTMLCVDLAGFMALAKIQVNAVSLVNLAAAVGIGVEFCVHVLHAFMEEQGGRTRRASAALGDVGASVLSGIAATKFVGVLVLAFAKTEIFRVYFFKFYFALVVLGALHGLVLLPVVLSLAGPAAFDSWPASVTRRR